MTSHRPATDQSRTVLSNPYQPDIPSNHTPNGPRENPSLRTSISDCLSYRGGTPDCSSSGRKLSSSGLEKKKLNQQCRSIHDYGFSLRLVPIAIDATLFLTPTARDFVVPDSKPATDWEVHVTTALAFSLTTDL